MLMVLMMKALMEGLLTRSSLEELGGFMYLTIYPSMIVRIVTEDGMRRAKFS